jgi:hypothetical protein
MAAEVETSWIPRESNGDPVNNRRSGNSACLFPAISYLQHGERSFLRRFLPTYMHAAWSNQRNYTPCRTTCYGERRHRAFLPGCAFFARRTIEKHRVGVASAVKITPPPPPPSSRRPHEFTRFCGISKRKVYVMGVRT